MSGAPTGRPGFAPAASLLGRLQRGLGSGARACAGIERAAVVGEAVLRCVAGPPPWDHRFTYFPELADFLAAILAAANAPPELLAEVAVDSASPWTHRDFQACFLVAAVRRLGAPARAVVSARDDDPTFTRVLAIRAEAFGVSWPKPAASEEIAVAPGEVIEDPAEARSLGPGAAARRRAREREDAASEQEVVAAAERSWRRGELDRSKQLVAIAVRSGGPSARALLRRMLPEVEHPWLRAEVLRGAFALRLDGLDVDLRDALWDASRESRRLAAEHAPLDEAATARLRVLAADPFEEGVVRAAASQRLASSAP